MFSSLYKDAVQLHYKMPNDCWNYITFTANNGDLAAFVEELEAFKAQPDWVLDVMRRGEGGVYMKLWSAWQPDFVWLEGLLAKYSSCWVKNEWSEEGGGAGVWVGTARGGAVVIKRLEWEDMSIEEECARFREVE